MSETYRHGSGSSTSRVYVVEARTSGMPRQHRGMILGSEWQRIEIPQGRVVPLFHVIEHHHGFLGFDDAFLFAQWWGSATAVPGEWGNNLCIETRLVEVEFKWRYETREIGVGPAMNLTETLRATKFTPRNAVEENPE